MRLIRYCCFFHVQTRDEEILRQVAKLSSHISRKEAMRKLSRMRKDKAHKESFTNSLPVFLLVHQLLGDYRCVSSRTRELLCLVWVWLRRHQRLALNPTHNSTGRRTLLWQAHRVQCVYPYVEDANGMLTVGTVLPLLVSSTPVV